MSGRIRADLAELQRCEAAARLTIERVDGLLADLRSFLTPLHASWTGEAAQRYAEHQHRWDVAAADLNDGLRVLHRIMAVSHVNYAATLETNAAMWRRP